MVKIKYEYIYKIKRIIKNYFFLKKYPFYKTRGYEYTMYDNLNEGWKKAFGKQLSNELREVCKRNNYLKDFKITDIKEKYGELRIYTNCANNEIYEIIEHYELLSLCYCRLCGRLVKYATHYDYLCEPCMKEIYKYDDEKLKEFRLTKDDIPKITRYIDGKSIEVKSDVDFVTL